MAANRKLTAVIAGRTVVAVEGDTAAAQVHFDDGSIMTVHLGAELPSAPPLGRIKSVRQQGVTLSLDYETGTTLALTTAEPTASVMLRAKDGTLEYAD